MKRGLFDLSGKNALITGGCGLLGKQNSTALIESGAKVFISDINKKKLKSVCEELGENAIPIYLDVTNQKSIKLSLNNIINKYKHIDILINNAAIDPKIKRNGIENSSRLENFNLTQWNRQIAVGLTGAFLVSQTYGGWMAKNGGGVILNIASDLSVISPDQRIYRVNGLSEELQNVKPVSYSVIKTGLIGLTRYLSTYWANKKIRVNAISPGGIFNNQPDRFVKNLKKLIPLNRMADIDDYKGAIQFLCSEASSYMTGQNIVIDGGRSVW